MIGRRIAHYVVEERLGAGAMGAVHLARDLALGRMAALKTVADELNPELRTRLLSEASTAARLQHPAIATFFEAGDADGTAYIAMEFVRGETLRARLAKGTLPLDESLRIAAALLEALNHAHAAGVLHRDIKPENIMLPDDERMPKLVDFGLAKVSAAVGEATLTNLSAGNVVGTIGYMSPEQLRGEPADARSDLFAFAAVLYEMLAGRAAFPGLSAAERLTAILMRDPAPLPAAVPAALSEILRRGLAKDVGARYQSASAFLRDLRALSSGDAPDDRPQTLAVLDLRNVSRRSEDDWIGSGIADSLTADLTRVPGLTIVGREKVLRTVRAIAGTAADAPDTLDVGGVLGCRWVLSGSFQRLGNAVRLTTTLTETATGQVVAAEKLDGTLDGIFEMQDRLSHAVAASLNLRVPSGVTAAAGRDVQAFEYYARGRAFWQRLEKGSMAQAGEMYERAIAIEPQYAPALAGLAAMHAMRFTYMTDPEELRRASEYARRAIASDPHLAEPHIWLGYALMREGHAEEAIAAERRAQALDPQNPYGWYFEACTHFFHGDAAAAVPLFQRVVQREMHPFAWLGLSAAHAALGRLEEAEWCVQHTVEAETTGAPGPTAGAGAYLAESLRLQGRLDDARRACLSALDLVERSDHMYRDSFRGVGLLTLARVALDQLDCNAAVAALRQLVAHLEGRDHTLGGGFLMVQALAALTRAGQGAEPLAAARRLFAARNGFNFSLLWLCTDDAALLELGRAAQSIGDTDAHDLLVRARDAGSFEAARLLTSTTV